jgi:hypothetical protein
LRKLLPLATALVLLAGVGPAFAQIACRAGQNAGTVAELLFGRNIGGQLGVTEAKWRAFLATEITARFPDGLTVYDAYGQWRNRTTNRIARERSKVVMIVLPGLASDDQRLTEIIAAYKERFKQQSVGLIVRPACVLF